MRILSVSLQDVKSYDTDAPMISFHEGVNAIIGENGSGKSTLCEAIGFALFDYLHPYSQADFVREGKKSGKVTVVFQTDNDGKQYRVERGVNQSKYDVYEAKSGAKIDLNGKDEVISWLKEHMGVPEMMNIQTLWKSSLGVPQGKFTNDFSQTPTIRAALFNPLLEVNVYRDLWVKMKGVIDVLKQQHDHLTDEITRLDAQIQDLPDLKQQSRFLATQIKKIQQMQIAISKEIKEKETQKSRLDQLHQTIQKLSHQLELHQEKEKELSSQLTQIQQELTVAEQAEALVKKHTAGYEQYKQISDQINKLDQEKNAKEQLEKQSLQLEKEQETLSHHIQQLKQDHRIANESKQLMETLKPAVKKQQRLEKEIDEIIQKQREVKEITQQHQQITEKISELRKRYQRLQKQIKEIKGYKKTADKKNEIEQQRENLLKKESVLSHQINDYETAINTLTDHDESKCPTCSQALSASQQKEIINQKRTILKQLKEQLQQIKKTINEVNNNYEEAVQASQQLSRLKDLNEMTISVQQEADEQKKKRKQLDDHVSRLQKKIKEKQTLTEALNTLGDAKTRYQKAQIRYEDHRGKESELQSAKQEQKQLQIKQQKISTNLKRYKGLDQKIETLKEKQKQLQSSYETVLQHKDTAARKDQRQKQLSHLSSSLNTITDQIKHTTSILTEKKDRFNTKNYDDLVTNLEKLHNQHISQQTQIKEWQKQKEEKDTLINEKKKAKNQVIQKAEEKKHLEKDIEFARFIRETFQQTRPLITEILVQEISRQADQIYRQLRGVASEQLTWTKDYEIIITENETTRAFHKLSGGEQMCAALAVRLAILKLLSNMDIVFLDEPTMNLDEHKKDNLVSQLRDLAGFSQIFVISHDETFESMTEHIITLEKRNGRTRLLQHFQGGF